MIISVFFSVLFTSFISGILGMGGGLILMGIFSILLPITSAMMIHGLTQMAANGFRAFLLRKDIQFRVLSPYLIGSLLSFLLFTSIQFVPSKEFVLIALGLSPLLGFSLSNKIDFDILKKQNAMLCGAVIMATQIMAGASGPLLDVFFLNSKMNRHQVIATKSFTQSFSHFLKLGYFGAIAYLSQKGLDPDLNWYLFPLVVLTAFTGTRLGKSVLDKISEQQFKSYGKSFAIGIGLFYFGRGIMGFF